MSNSMKRRVFSSFRQFSLISSLHSSAINTNPVITHPGFKLITCTFQLSRGFANLRNTQAYYDNVSDDEDGSTYGAVDFGNAVKSVALSQMEAALEALPRDLDKLPKPATIRMLALNRMNVKINGAEIPFNKVAAVSVLCEQTLSVTPYHLNARETIKKSISKKKEKEKLGLSISGFIPEDAKMLEKEVDEMTKKYIMSVEDICKSEVKKIFTDYFRAMVDVRASWRGRRDKLRYIPISRNVIKGSLN